MPLCTFTLSNTPLSRPKCTVRKQIVLMVNAVYWQSELGRFLCNQVGFSGNGEKRKLKKNFVCPLKMVSKWQFCRVTLEITFEISSEQTPSPPPSRPGTAQSSRSSTGAHPSQEIQKILKNIGELNGKHNLLEDRVNGLEVSLKVVLLQICFRFGETVIYNWLFVLGHKKWANSNFAFKYKPFWLASAV